MEFTKVSSFITYYETVRDITNKVISVIPEDKMNWSYYPGKFSIADLLRHIAAIERNLFAEVIQGKPSRYAGCGSELADSYVEIVNYFQEMHEQSMRIFSSLTDADLGRKITTLNGREVSISNFLRALVIHETHHRGALIIYLNLLGTSTPPVLGLTEEQVVQLSKSTL
ncbi:MAG TPA: DinB family protein [Ferruginibacter sp.]|nr:DinB family protein [Ferruginibacter sp.]